VDLAQFGKRFLHQGKDLLRPESVEQMVHLQAQSGSTRRGLGFALRSCDPEASSYPFSQNAFGHTGFTGTSLWIDPDRSLVVACLSNAVYHGRVDRGFQRFRVALHHAIVEAVEGGGG
jgi:CubicO group peptidase (beta-lactamase class C family)